MKDFGLKTEIQFGPMLVQGKECPVVRFRRKRDDGSSEYMHLVCAPLEPKIIEDGPISTEDVVLLHIHTSLNGALNHVAVNPFMLGLEYRHLLKKEDAHADARGQDPEAPKDDGLGDGTGKRREI